MTKYPALDISGVDSDLLEALVDDYAPTAAQPLEPGTTYFFTDGHSRDLAHAAISAAWPSAAVHARDVDDEDWARRSQENLKPVTVGRMTVSPPWHKRAATPTLEPPTSNLEPPPSSPESRAPSLESIEIVIAPSMGFGTGHHATTRLCLAALQRLNLTGQRVLDVGTGSGVLAIAARALGAASAVGLDYDADAIQAAQENLDANPAIDQVRFDTGDLRDVGMAPADVVLANLTGALLVQSASLLVAAVRPGGQLILSGLLAHERDEVVAAFDAMASVRHEAVEDGWVGLTLDHRSRSAV